MPTILTHAVVGATIAQASSATSMRRLTIAAALCAALPDVDVLAFHFGVPYESMLGHRGLSHSLFFAMVVGAIAEFSRRSKPGIEALPPWWREPTGLIFLLATASHGLLDALTDGGLGVAFFAPFSRARYFFPWRPIAVSPIGARFFSARGADVLLSEFAWVWIPTAVVLVAILVARRRARRA